MIASRNHMIASIAALDADRFMLRNALVDGAEGQ